MFALDYTDYGQFSSFCVSAEHVRIPQNQPGELFIVHMAGPRVMSLELMQTPRALHTSTDAQTWEFSHHKFWRAQPDLLKEIKRKVPEPDPSIKHRIELSGEVAAQLAQMCEDDCHVASALAVEKAKTERLAILTKASTVPLRKTSLVGVCPRFSVHYNYANVILSCVVAPLNSVAVQIQIIPISALPVPGRPHVTGVDPITIRQSLNTELVTAAL